MRAILNSLLYPSRSYATKAWTAMLVVLTICLCASVAAAQTVPAIITTQINWLNTLAGGGALASGNAAGSSFGVNSVTGDLIVGNSYGNKVLDISAKTGVETVLVNWGVGDNYNVGPVALDSQNNLYVAGLYTNNVIKIPFVSGAYVAAPDPTLLATYPANCTGTDTAECSFGSNLTNSTNGWYFGIQSMTFDAAGDFFFSLTNSNTAPEAIYECTAACIATGSPAATIIYEEPASVTAAQLMVGGMAIDPWGNLFFTDSSYNGNKNESLYSDLNELPVSTGAGYGGATTGFAAAPIVLYTETIATPGSYDDELDGVAIDPVSGTVYFADQFNGIYAYPNSSGTINTANLYTVATQGAKVLALDANDNLYGVTYSSAIGSGGDTAFQILVNNLEIPPSPGVDVNGVTNSATTAAGSTASSSYNVTEKVAGVSTVETGSYITVIDNATTCTASPSLTLGATGGNSAEFLVANTVIVPPATQLLAPECSATLNGGASYPVTVGFTPAASAVGTQAATLTVADSSSNTATAAVSGAAPSIFVTQVNWLNNLAGGGALASGNAAGSSFGVNTATGDIIISTTYGNKVLDINTTTGAETVLVNWGVGDNYNVGPVALDSQNNLYVGGLYTNNVIKIPFVSGAYVAAPDPTLLATYPANCTGTDTAECSFGSNLTNSTNGWYFGIQSMTFDAAGDFFFSLTNANTAPEAIYECTAACIATGSPAATMIYEEPASTTADQLLVGGLAIDPWGNLFFTDSSYNGNKNESVYSDLNELPVSTGAGYGGATTGFAAAPTVIYTETIATPGSYDDELDAVAVDPTSGTVYLADQFNGVVAFQNNSGTVNPASIYTVSTQGAKVLALDAMDNLYGAVYSSALGSSGDTAFKVSVNNVLVPGLPGIAVNGVTNPSATQVGTTANTTYNVTEKVAGVSTVETGSYVTVVDNGTTCTANPTVNYALSGADGSEFAGEDTVIVAPATALLMGSCNGTISNTASYPATISFTPTGGGTQSATLTVTDAALNSGTATVSGVGQSLIPQVVSFTSPAASESVVYGVAPITVAATTNSASGIPVVVTIDGASTPNAGTLTGGVLTVNSAGTIILDANEAGDGVTYAAAAQVQLTITVTQATQAITFTNPTASETIAYSATPIVLAATGGASTNPVTFTVTGPATLAADGVTLTVTGPGSIVVDANQAASTNYSAAPQASLTITVTQAAQAISVTGGLTQTITFTSTPITLAATGGASGNTVVFTKVSGPATLSGTALTLTGLGTVTIDVNQAGNADYSAAPQVQLVITVSPIGVVANPSFSIPAGTYYGTSTTVSLATSTTGATIHYTLTNGTTGAVPTDTSTKYTTEFALNKVETVTIEAKATELGYTDSGVVKATYVVSAGVPDFTFKVDPSALTITAGNSGEVDAIVTGSPDSAPFIGDVVVSCTGLPTGAQCNGGSVLTITPDGSSKSVEKLLKITTSSNSYIALSHTNPLLPGGATLAALFCFLGFKKRSRLQMMLLLAASAIGLSLFTGCGAQWSPTFSVSNVTVTAVASVNGVQLEKTATLTLTVNK